MEVEASPIAVEPEPMVETAAPTSDPTSKPQPSPTAEPTSEAYLSPFYFTAGDSPELWFQDPITSTSANYVFEESERSGDVYAVAYCYQDDTVYYTTTTQGIYKTGVGTATSPTSLFQNGPSSEVRGLDIDPYTEQIYWVDFALGQLMRGNTDGSSVTMVALGFTNAHDIALRFSSDQTCDSMYISAEEGIYKTDDCDGNGMNLLYAHAGPKGLACSKA